MCPCISLLASVYLKSPSVVPPDMKVSLDYLVQKIVSEYDLKTGNAGWSKSKNSELYGRARVSETYSRY